MKNCPNCKHPEMPGVIFCSECGSRILQIDTQYIQEKDQGHVFDSNEIEGGNQDGLPTEVPQIFSLIFQDISLPVQIDIDGIVVLGRGLNDQSVLPDINFQIFKAYELGVSRLHAAIKNKRGELLVCDLGSSNGTYLNGVKLVPYMEYHIHEGDFINLGKLKAQVMKT